MTPKLRYALHEITGRILVEIRTHVWFPVENETKDQTLKRIASLADLGHNLPLWLNGSEDWNEALFRKKLKVHEAEFPSRLEPEFYGFREQISAIFERAMAP